MSAQHTLIYARLLDSVGADGARLYARSQQDAVDHVERTAQELSIDCDLERLPAFTYVESDAGVDAIRTEVEAARQAGLAASFVTGTGLPFGVAGAIRVEDQAQFHPRRYLLALAEAATQHGAALYERTRAVGLEEGEPCRVTTERGNVVTAGDVVVATHYPVFDRALLFARLVPHRELVVAAAIPAERDPGGMFISEEEGTRSVRTAPWMTGGGCCSSPVRRSSWARPTPARSASGSSAWPRGRASALASTGPPTAGPPRTTTAATGSRTSACSIRAPATCTWPPGSAAGA